MSNLKFYGSELKYQKHATFIMVFGFRKIKARRQMVFHAFGPFELLLYFLLLLLPILSSI
jgi:hypothetical protein